MLGQMYGWMYVRSDVCLVGCMLGQMYVRSDVC